MLILPDKYKNQEIEDHQALKKHLMFEIDSIINDNQNKKDPYFILCRKKFHDNSYKHLVGRCKIFFRRPPLWKGSVVFWVDNSRGLVTWLWHVTSQGKVEWNIPMAKKLKGILRSVAS